MTQESANVSAAERNNRAPIREWLVHYLGLMESDVKQHAHPIGLNRLVKNRALEKRIAEVRAHLDREVTAHNSGIPRSNF